ncbi:uncharacterized protein M421DRAFT_99035 [Didymella exigua CBS 183.55]|uniref:N-acetyltransferase domain-containing protein n=1 Tax=Didymella exigua CBS 183.55 TaxID=1150837 RepID=A0A6A5RU85_9PLEO|nr:uncharacterized protein M421DRAFT_99035 [Didymella exigua CBS 183.55]KAF1931119.1 hypothetical protein M421DRAFT_99035 [Didymella exigua CBS 183.55]
MNTTIEPYNPDWPAHFSQIRNNLAAHLQHIPGTAYSHIGSTSIHGLPAQPTIDILLTVPPADVDKVSAALTSSGAYRVKGGPHGTVLCARGATHQHAHTVYACAVYSLAARIHTAIRDTLRSDIELRDEYAARRVATLSAAKGAAFELEDEDRPAYVRAKNDALQERVMATAHFTSEELPAVFGSGQTARWDQIRTPRLLLRESEMSDVEGMFALEGSEENARYQDWAPWTHSQARQNVLRGLRESYSGDRRVVELAVVHKGVFVGRVGGRVTAPSSLVDGLEHANGAEATRTEAPETSTPKHVDLWFSLLRTSQGYGLATEAMTAFISTLVAREKVDNAPLELEIECDPRNTGSRKLAARLAFSQHSLTRRAWESKGEWVDSLVCRKMID